MIMLFGYTEDLHFGWWPFRSMNYLECGVAVPHICIDDNVQYVERFFYIPILHLNRFYPVLLGWIVGYRKKWSRVTTTFNTYTIKSLFTGKNILHAEFTPAKAEAKENSAHWKELCEEPHLNPFGARQALPSLSLGLATRPLPVRRRHRHSLRGFPRNQGRHLPLQRHGPGQVGRRTSADGRSKTRIALRTIAAVFTQQASRPHPETKGQLTTRRAISGTDSSERQARQSLRLRRLILPRTMPATRTAAIPALQVILLGEDHVRPVEVIILALNRRLTGQRPFGNIRHQRAPFPIRLKMSGTAGNSPEKHLHPMQEEQHRLAPASS